MRRRYLCGALVGVLTTAAALATAWSAAAARPSTPVARPSSMHVFRPFGYAHHGNKPARPNHTNNLYYHGGVGGIGVETAPKVYLVFWGSQWGTSGSTDPSGEGGILQSFLGDVGGSPWLRSVTQYCQNVGTGTTTCPSGSAFASNAVAFSASPSSVWYDSGLAAPSQPTQSQLAGEAVRAAAHFGNTASGSNASTQYVIATAHGNNASGFGTQYCAWHSSTSSSYGYIAYTNLPYITDAGGSCGADFVNPAPAGTTDGITIVEGHELAETITDQFPNGGWLDGSNSENGDKCAWSPTTSNQTMGGGSFPVQPLWSNATSSCVLSY
jgi:serine protease